MNPGIVATIPDLCKRCYSCVRECPAIAIRVEGGQAYRGHQDGNYPLEADDLDGLVLCCQPVERREEVSSQGGGLDRVHTLSVRYLHDMENMKRTLF